MAQVTLIGPRRLNMGGVLYKRGETIEMDDALAVSLEDDPRFKVKGIRLSADEVQVSRQRAPIGDTLMTAIRTAIDELDVDDDDSFDRHGKPSVRAISALLGYTVTAEDRDRAMGRTAARGQLETAEGGLEATTGQPSTGLRLQRPRLTQEQRDALAKKAAVVNQHIPSGAEAAQNELALEMP